MKLCMVVPHVKRVCHAQSRELESKIEMTGNLFLGGGGGS